MNPPQHLFQFRSLSGAYGRAGFEKLILQSQLYFRSPLNFNDPFDCLPRFDFGTSRRETKEYVGRLTQIQNPVTRYQRRKARRIAKSRLSEGPALLADRRWQESLAESSVSCFSESGENLLMWGHYADSHKGVCFRFNEGLTRTIDLVAFPVKYSDERPVINVAKQFDSEALRKGVLWKSKDWSYEREHRIVKWKKPEGYYPIPKKSLDAVILGTRISEGDEQYVRGVLAARPEVTLLRAQLDETEFKVKMVDA